MKVTSRIRLVKEGRAYVVLIHSSMEEALQSVFGGSQHWEEVGRHDTREEADRHVAEMEGVGVRVRAVLYESEVEIDLNQVQTKEEA